MSGNIDGDDTSVKVLRAGISERPLARQAICEIHGRKLENERAVTAFLSNESCYLFLAVSGEEVVGSLNGYALRRPHCEQPQFLLYEIDVEESWRRQGIGSRLVDAFVAEAQKQRAFEVWVLTNESNAPAMAMYRKCGFMRENPDDVMLSLESCSHQLGGT